MFEPLPEASRVMTPAVEEGFPKALALLTVEVETDPDEEEVVVEVVSKVDDEGETVAAPEADKVKIWL